MGLVLGEDGLRRHPGEDLVVAAVPPKSSRTSRRRPASTSTRCSRSTEASSAGYDEAILLTPEGTVADGSGENIFVVS